MMTLDMLATLFVNPMILGRQTQMFLLVPLCLAISIVYKTTKCATLREIPLAVLVSWITIVVGMYAVGGVLMLLYHLAS